MEIDRRDNVLDESVLEIDNAVEDIERNESVIMI